jgi:hypothetical protein
LLTTILPSTADLVARALADTDFLAEIRADSANIRDSADIAIEVAAVAWEESHDAGPGALIPSHWITAARDALIDAGHDLLARDEADAIVARLDSIDAGDIDADGEPVPYDRYVGV